MCVIYVWWNTEFLHGSSDHVRITQRMEPNTAHRWSAGPNVAQQEQLHSKLNGSERKIKMLEAAVDRQRGPKGVEPRPFWFPKPFPKARAETENRRAG